MNNNSSVIAVLCSHLCADNCRPFEQSEWSKLAKTLREHDLEPKDIPDLSDDDYKGFLGYGKDEIERIKRLLDRAGSLGFELEKLSSFGINVITRADKDYPRQLKTKLRGGPPMFYYAGELELLNRRTVGFVGSRTVGEDDTSFTDKTVGKIVSRGFGVVSGGAKGIDSASAAASLSKGGFCIEYIADSFLRRLKKSEVISGIQENKLLIMSMAKPDAGFNVGMAMQRNKFIYAQSVTTVVVKSDYNKGGTWSGATEALNMRYCPVLCRNRSQYPGNVALIRLGAIPIDDNWDGDVDNIGSSVPDIGEQLSLFDGAN